MGIEGIVGDPAAMRQYASQLQQIAERLAAVASGLRQSVDAMTFQGPAATGFRQRMGSWQFASAGAAAAIHDAAEAMHIGAGRVEVEQAEAARRHRVAEERRAEDARRRAASERGRVP